MKPLPSRTGLFRSRMRQRRRTSRVSQMEQLESRTLLNAEWRNPLVSIDVDGDGFVAPIDALVGINELNTNGSRELTEERFSGEPFYDSDGDGFLSPIDPLLVINALNDGFRLPLRLNETGQFSNEQSFLIQTGQDAGTRHYRFRVTAQIDDSDKGPILEDRLAVYLVDADDRSKVLLSSEPGGAIFSYDGEKAEFTPGRVAFDGSVVEVDLSELTDVNKARLVFQLLSNDTDSGTRFTILPLSNTADATGQVGPRFEPLSQRAQLTTVGDPPILAENSSLQPEISNVRFNPSDGLLRADLQIRNTGQATGRDILVEFPALPAGVLVRNSQTSANGNPVLNIRNAIPFGGLGRNSRSRTIAMEIENPNDLPISLKPTILSGGANRSPELDPIPPLEVMPGGVVQVALNATDEDGDPVTFEVHADMPLPAGELGGNGQLSFRPLPGDEGEYSFTLLAKDGHDAAAQQVTLSVVPDAITTTRISGLVLNTALEPLDGITISVGELSTTTSVDGSFQLETSSPLTADTLKIHGEEFVGEDVYPFIAEKLNLLFGRSLIAGVNNQISRPIYLPALDIANGQTVDPTADTTITTAAIPGASVFVAAGTLQGQNGQPFAGTLSITEVPVDLTPAALPDNLFPDLVVTIQPGEMVFTQPAPLTFPNRMEFAPGLLMDLWSINPITGDFDDVGDMRVSDDGQSIETVSGGIRNSSWHFPAPIPSNRVVPQQQEPFNARYGCSRLPSTCTATSDVEMQAGTLHETHAVPTYRSLGVERGVRLTYDSARADGQTNLAVSLDEVPLANFARFSPRLVGQLRLESGSFTQSVQGTAEPFLGIPAGAFIWSFPDSTNPRSDVRAAAQVDLSDYSTGVIDYQFSIGRFALLANQFSGRLEDDRGESQLVHVNTAASSFGAGWGIDGLQELFEQSDGSVLLVDGNGTELLFQFNTDTSEFQSPPGDFSQLRRLPDNTFQRTFPDQTIALFNQRNMLASVTDRNGNRTEYEYDGVGRLTQIIDPVGLVTTFDYSGGQLSSIVDPAGRQTSFAYDGQNNLVSITDPDTSTRTFEYDDFHRMTTEVGKRGFREEIIYDSAGRVQRVILKDGTTRHYSPVQSESVILSQLVTDVNSTLPAQDSHSTEAMYADGRGRVVSMSLDRLGQQSTGFDGIGSLSSAVRGQNNLVNASFDARGRRTRFEYDSNGNRIQQNENLRLSRREVDFPAQTLLNANQAHFGDVNNDGLLDALLAEINGNELQVRLALPGGQFADSNSFAVGNGVFNISSFDANADGNLDVATVNFDDDTVSVLFGDGSGNFSQRSDYPTGRFPANIASGDLNGDSRDDLITTNFDGTLTVLLANVSGTFDTTTTAFVPAQSLLLEDINGDSHLDLVVPFGFDQLRIANGLGDGTFDSPTDVTAAIDPLGVTSGDFDLDGRTDLAVSSFSGQSTVFLYDDGTGTFPDKQTVAVSFRPTALHRGDFNHDGVPDVVASSSAGAVILASGGDRTYRATELADLTEIAQVVDLDDDDRLDLAAIDIGRTVLHYGSDGASFKQVQEFAVQDNPIDVAAGDFNNDGFTDLVTIGKASNDGLLLLGEAAGGYVDGGSIASGLLPKQVVTSDLDNDGNLDLIIAGLRTRLLQGDGTGSFTEPTSPLGSASASSVAVAHLNDDNRADFVVTNTNRDAITVFLSGPSSLSYTEETLAAGAKPKSVQLADFNGDRIPDIAVANQDTESVALILNNGAGNFAAARHLDVGSAFDDLVSGDFDFDGNTDLAVLRADEQLISLFYGLGNAAFGDPAEFHIPGDGVPRSLAVADVNSDGASDLTVINDAAIHLYLGDFSRRIEAPFSFAAPLAQAVTPADADGDGSIDLITVNSTEDSISVLDNGSVVTQRWTYDSTFNQQTSYTDELGRQTLTEIDPLTGNTRLIRRVIGHNDTTSSESDDIVTQFTYTQTGQVDKRIDPLGRVTDFDYDSFGRLIKATAAQGTTDESTTRYEYDAAGNQTASIDPNGNRRELSYDSHNRVLTITEPDPDEDGPLSSATTVRSYDANGNMTRDSDPLGNVSEYAYDEMNRQVSFRNAVAEITRYDYDPTGNLTLIVDPAGRSTRFQYDLRGRLASETNANGETTTHVFDLDGNRIRTTDPSGNSTHFVYDSRNRLRKEVDSNGQSFRLTYDATDNLITAVDRNGRRIHSVFDQADRIISEQWIGQNGDVDNVVDYSYDKAGNLVNVQDGFSSYSTTYDNRDRPIIVDNNNTPGAPAVTLDYRYDAADNLVVLSETIFGDIGGSTVNRFDGRNRPTKIQQTGPGVRQKSVSLAYNDVGQFSLIQRSPDISGDSVATSSSFAYDSLLRLTELVHSNSQQQINSVTLSYDEANRVIERSTTDGTTRYEHDAVGQLTATSGIHNEAFSYDLSGNRSSSAQSQNQISPTGNELISDAFFSYEYDHEGNLTKRTDLANGAVREFSWDHRNRLVGVNDFEQDSLMQVITYTYDVFDRRIRKSVDNTPDDTVEPAVTDFVFNGNDVILDFEPTPAATNSHKVTTRYLHGPAVDQLFAQESEGNIEWLLGDHLGSVTDIVDDSGNPLTHFQYDAFGNVLNSPSPGPDSRYRFTGREFDSETGLYYFRARYFDSRTGRFISQDPIRYRSTDANYYRYALNNPTQLRDPFGLDPWYGNYAGPGNNGYDTTPTDAFDAAARLHDIAYEQAGADGAAGVLFDVNVAGADLELGVSAIGNTLNPLSDIPYINRAATATAGVTFVVVGGVKYPLKVVKDAALGTLNLVDEAIDSLAQYGENLFTEMNGCGF